MNTTKTILLLLSLVAVLIGYRLLRNSSESAPPSATEQLPVNDLAQTGPDMTDAGKNVESDETDRPVACLTKDELRVHPVIRQLMSQLESASVEGADIEIFRGLEEATVTGFAEQGDSAAMAVTGAILVMRAYKLDDSLAIDWLSRGGHIEGVETGQPLSSDASLALNDAAYWFYRAALYGRLFALRNYGQVRDRLFGGAVGLGWVSQEEYDSLDTDQLNELLPENLYRKLVFDLAPQLDTGLNWSPSMNVLRSETAGRIRNDLFQEFHTALADSDLPPLNAPAAATLQELDELRSQICDSEKQEE